MKAFADLLERLAFTPARNSKLTLLRAYLSATPDPERGLVLAALTGDMRLSRVPPSLLRKLIEDRVDPELFRLSYDFVGDLAETIALIWPDSDTPRQPLPLAEAVALLSDTPKLGLPAVLTEMMDQLNATERYALLKLATGGLRVGVSRRLAILALAEMGNIAPDEITELWHGLAPPYLDLFGWLDGGTKPLQAAAAPFRPVMLATAVDLEALAPHRVQDYLAEWKWDGIRVQASSEGGTRRLYTRTGEDISHSFPDLLEALDFEGTLDGELLLRDGAQTAPFATLQTRLNRKSVSAAMIARHPAYLRAYDILFWNGTDLRALPLAERRAMLEGAVVALDSPKIETSPLVDFTDWPQLDALRRTPPDPVVEGIMLKRVDSAYVAGRPRGPWFKWKRDPMLVDAVLLYAQRGHGKRSGFYSDFTFGVWGDEGQLVPVGKAYFGFTDAELREIDKFVRANTTDRFGPVRAVAPKLVFEVAFEGLNASSRHKSGVAMRFPRIHRIRWDKPAAEADHLDSLRALLG